MRANLFNSNVEQSIGIKSTAAAVAAPAAAMLDAAHGKLAVGTNYDPATPAQEANIGGYTPAGA